MRREFAILLSFVSIVLSAGYVFGGDKRSTDTYGGENRSYEGQHLSSQAIVEMYSTSITDDYNSFEECLTAIKKETGSTLDIITDQSTQITGFLSNGKHFGCVEKVTDEKGTYVHGWHTTE